MSDAVDLHTPTNKVQKRNENVFKVTPNVRVRPILVIKNRDAEKVMSNEYMESVKRSVKSVINPVTDPVKCMRETKKGKLIIECNDKKSLEVIKKKISDQIDDEEIQVAEPQASNPIIKLIGITEFDTKEKLLSDIRRQNDGIVNSESKMEVLSVIQTTRYYTATIKTDMQTFESVMKRQRIYVGWDSVRVVQLNTGVTRCYKCAHYNHVSKDCTEDSYVCPKCAGPHQIRDCTSKTVKCINCVRSNEKMKLDLPTDHFVWDSRCPMFQRKFRNATNRVRLE